MQTNRSRRTKTSHKLHFSKDSAALLAALNDLGIDLVKHVREFVRPDSEVGIVVTGSLANGIGTEASDLDVMVLMSSLSGMKKRRDQVDDCAVNYMPHADGSRLEVTMFIRGIDLNINFIANEVASNFCADREGRVERSSASMEDHYHMRFLGRLGNCWVIHNADLVKRWKSYFEVDKFRFNRIATEFTAAAKNLEDMHASIGRGPGCVGILGISIVSKAMQALLAYSGFSFVSGKWLRKVNEFLADKQSASHGIFEEGRRLLFPGLFTTVQEETDYFGSVQRYCQSVRKEVSRDPNISSMIDDVVQKFDIMLPD